VVPLVEVHITQDLDLACLPRVGMLFETILSMRPGHVVVDLADCRRATAAAIGLLLDVHRHLAGNGSLLTMRHVAPAIRRALRATGPGRSLLIEPGHGSRPQAPDPSDAVAAMSAADGAPAGARGQHRLLSPDRHEPGR
jgi:ABC-type transporter Mla MlaB component